MHLMECGTIIANKETCLQTEEPTGDLKKSINCSGMTWMTKEGLKKPNYWGSLTQASTCRVGNFKGEEVYVAFNKLLPMVDPNNIVLGGWDISGLNLAESMERAQVSPPSVK